MWLERSNILVVSVALGVLIIAVEWFYPSASLMAGGIGMLGFVMLALRHRVRDMEFHF